MNRAKLRILALSLVLSALFASCGNGFSSVAKTKGTLVLTQSYAAKGAKDLAPSGGITLSTWDLALTKSGSTTVEVTGLDIATANYTAVDLDAGDWNATINGRNAAGAVIAEGSKTVTVEAGKSTAVSITISLLSGTGELSLSASWTYSLASPKVVGTLTPSGGAAATLFTMTTGGDKSSATYSATGIATGSYLLELTLSDSGEDRYYHGPEAVLIAANIATSGTIASWNTIPIIIPPPSVTKVIDHSFYDPDTLSDAEVAAAAKLRAYFEHASVGQDIVGDSSTNSSVGVKHTDTSGDYCGLALLYQSNSRYLCLRHHWGSSEGTSPSASWWTSSGGLGDYHRENPPAEYKVSGFQADMTSAMASALDVASFKFCYIDNPSDAASLFATVKTAMEGLETSYSGVNFVWWTMPLTNGYDASNNERLAYNQLVRSYCSANGKWLLDIADLESHDDAGNAIIDYYGYEAIYDGYTSDGGHLSDAGALKLAKAYWMLLAQIAKTK